MGISKWKSAIEERLPAAAMDNDDDIYDDDGEADIDVDSLLLAASSTPNVKPQREKTASGSTQEDQVKYSHSFPILHSGKIKEF